MEIIDSVHQSGLIARNPQGLSSCETVCEQKYHRDGQEIDRHTITRTFTKGTFGGRDVTLVTVAKT